MGRAPADTSLKRARAGPVRTPPPRQGDDSPPPPATRQPYLTTPPEQTRRRKEGGTRRRAGVQSNSLLPAFARGQKKPLPTGEHGNVFGSFLVVHPRSRSSSSPCPSSPTNCLPRLLNQDWHRHRWLLSNLERPSSSVLCSSLRGVLYQCSVFSFCVERCSL